MCHANGGMPPDGGATRTQPLLVDSYPLCRTPGCNSSHRKSAKIQRKEEINVTKRYKSCNRAAGVASTSTSPSDSISESDSDSAEQDSEERDRDIRGEKPPELEAESQKLK
jgi:hypothetical protein